MTNAAALREIKRLRAEIRARRAATGGILARLRADPSLILTWAGLTPDPWQTDLLRSSADRVLILAARQVGKSEAVAGRALREALTKPGSLTLLLSPTLRQSGELLRAKVLPLYRALGNPVPMARESALSFQLANGSRVVSLPGEEGNIRGFSSVALLVIDEAARVPDELYEAVRPMLAVSGGTLVCLSSAYAKAGFFYEAWVNGGPEWRRFEVKGVECPRISRRFLEEERQAMGDRIFSREYENEFLATDAAAFDPDAVARALAAPLSGPPLFT